MKLLNIDRTLSVMLTYRCNAECGDCGTLSNPRIREKLDERYLIEAIRQAAEIGFKNVVFTGGEATIYKRLLRTGIRAAKEFGLKTRLVTNGIWANHESRASEVISSWIDIGLEELNLSTGDQHQRFVPTAYIHNAIVAADAAGIHCLLMIEKYEHSKVTKHSFLKEPRIRSLYDKGAFTILESPWMPLNPSEVRTYAMGETASSNNLASFGGCDSVLQTYVIGTDPGVYSCCGIGARLVPELRSSSQFDGDDKQSLRRIVYEAEQDFLKLWIRAEGTEKILSWCSEKDDRIKWEGQYAHKCQACLRIYSDPRVKDVVRKHYTEKVPDIIFREFVGENIDSLVGMRVA